MHRPIGLFLVLGALACSGQDGKGDATTPPQDIAADLAADVPVDTATDVPADIPADLATDVPDPGPGTCRAAGLAAGTTECRAYGAGWTRQEAQADCAALRPGVAGTWSPDPCPVPADELGSCAWESGGRAQSLAMAGPPGRCNAARAACLLATPGTFTAGASCQGLGAPDGGWGASPFAQPYRLCLDPRDGEPAGATEGHVCTWTLISGCTEPGRRFEDYGYCPDVITQRPYTAAAATATALGDPRLSDAIYMAEVNWAAKQVEACGCACCHTNRLAPAGPANWFTDAPGIWTDGIRDSGLALMVGLADSRALGAFPPGDNNGFDRAQLGLPTSDVPRMKAFLDAEWARRGLTEEFGRGVPPFGGPLVEQFTFVPEACAGGEGVAADGEVWWGGIEARYLYVMEADAKCPVVPPNLDIPVGTLWLLTVPNVLPAFAEARYGQTLGDQVQVVPAEGAPPALVSGRQYYLVALLDIGLPATRCLFTAP